MTMIEKQVPSDHIKILLTALAWSQVSLKFRFCMNYSNPIWPIDFCKYMMNVNQWNLLSDNFIKEVLQLPRFIFLPVLAITSFHPFIMRDWSNVEQCPSPAWTCILLGLHCASRKCDNFVLATHGSDTTRFGCIWLYVKTTATEQLRYLFSQWDVYDGRLPNGSLSWLGIGVLIWFDGLL
jgi:hypothetical protein